MRQLSRRRLQLYAAQWIQAVVDAVIGIILWAVSKPQKQKLPPINDPILLLSATELAAAIRKGKVTSKSAVEAYIARIRYVDPLVNAVVDSRFSEALQDAAEVDHYIQTSGKSNAELQKEKPFLGVPISIKSNIACKGMKHESGLVARRGIRAQEDAEAVSALRRAGAIILVTSNVPELSTSYRAYNKLNGHTWNPHDLSRTSGGSTGGESALISSGASLVGLGNDMCGSLRMPACVTGVFAHKPTAEMVSTSGLYPPLEGFLRQMLVQGPMCRYATDLAPVLEILAGSNKHKLKLDQEVDLTKLTFYYLGNEMDMNYIPAKENSKKAVRKVLSYFQKTHGIAVKLVSLPFLKDAIEMGACQCKATATRSYASFMANHPERKIGLGKEIVKFLLGLSNHTVDSLLFAALEAHAPVRGSPESEHWDVQFAKLRIEVDDILQENCVLIYPSCPESALYSFEAVSKFLMMQYFVPFNVLGLPATQCPVGMSADGYPLGVQVVGGKSQDRVTIAVAREIELAFGGWCKPCPVNVTKDILLNDIEVVRNNADIDEVEIQVCNATEDEENESTNEENIQKVNNGSSIGAENEDAEEEGKQIGSEVVNGFSFRIEGDDRVKETAVLNKEHQSVIITEGISEGQTV